MDVSRDGVSTPTSLSSPAMTTAEVVSNPLKAIEISLKNVFPASADEFEIVVGDGFHEDNDDPDLDVEGEDKLDDESDLNKVFMEGDNDEPIYELDKANFSKNKSFGSRSKVNGTCVCAVKFHLMLLIDEVHEQFIEETESKTPCRCGEHS
ncbi:hypothetical protein D1007_13880 [Hordeum vulgare]|nr:hypothetical protein D1007_13880 [Hordeum vulgare]